LVDEEIIKGLDAFLLVQLLDELLKRGLDPKIRMA
jgi:hypothetical protein